MVSGSVMLLLIIFWFCQ